MKYSYCRLQGEYFPLTEDLHYVYYTDSTLVWCPVCLAHGNRRIHLLDDVWTPGFENTNAATEEAAAMA